MKITYEFDTNHPDFYDDDSKTLYRIQKIDDIALCLETMRRAITKLIKYNNRASILTSEIEEKFWEIIKEHEINFEKLGY